MNLGSMIVLIVLIAIVGAIVGSWIRAWRQGRHIACDDCGGCSGKNPDKCPQVERLIRDVDKAAEAQKK
jgi:hypothetical protein